MAGAAVVYSVTAKGSDWHDQPKHPSTKLGFEPATQHVRGSAAGCKAPRGQRSFAKLAPVPASASYHIFCLPGRAGLTVLAAWRTLGWIR